MRTLSAVLMEGRSMKLPAYEVLAQAFVAEGVDTVFTLMGDANMHWANAMAKHNGVRLVHTRHEHCAVAAAASYTWATGRPGVASVTCGSGFTQTMTALVTAVRGHVPLVIMAGETPMGAAYHNHGSSRHRSLRRPELATSRGTLCCGLSKSATHLNSKIGQICYNRSNPG
jgi:thiamine pyrophosphate-dependent acetolactate synthase large subunit-like protein